MRPRIRTIKPEIWADEKIGDLSHSARLLFVGLITMADDEGKLRELPAAILGHIFPYDGVNQSKLAHWLDEVSGVGLVVRYAVEGKRYLAFPHWREHQKVDKPRVSDLPDFDDSSSIDRRTTSDAFDDHSRPTRARASGPDPIPSVPSRFSKVARELFDYWRERCNHPAARPTQDRLGKIRARLAEDYTPEQIREAIDGAAAGAFVNDAGKRFDDIELICRSGSKLESFIGRRASVSRVPGLRPQDRGVVNEQYGLREGESVEEWQRRRRLAVVENREETA